MRGIVVDECNGGRCRSSSKRVFVHGVRILFLKLGNKLGGKMDFSLFFLTRASLLVRPNNGREYHHQYMYVVLQRAVAIPWTPPHGTGMVRSGERQSGRGERCSRGTGCRSTGGALRADWAG